MNHACTYSTDTELILDFIHTLNKLAHACKMKFPSTPELAVADMTTSGLICAETRDIPCPGARVVCHSRGVTKSQVEATAGALIGKRIMDGSPQGRLGIISGCKPPHSRSCRVERSYVHHNIC